MNYLPPQTVAFGPYDIGNGAQVAKVLVTPAYATALLARNTGNRPLKRGNVRNIARDLTAGLWKFDGATIVVAETGRLMDGQHRLEACVESGVAFPALLVTGLSETVQQTIDSGVSRRLGDRLGMKQVPNANATACAIGLLVSLAGVRKDTGRLLSHSLSQQVLDAHPNLTVSVSAAHKSFSGWQSRLAALHYIGCYSGFSDRSEAMISVWRNGVPDYPGDAMHLLRERMVKSKVTLRQADVLDLMAAAWNAFRCRKPLKVLKAAKGAVDGWSVKDLGINTTLIS